MPISGLVAKVIVVAVVCAFTVALFFAFGLSGKISLNFAVIVFPATVFYNILFWKYIDLELYPARGSFPVWVQEKGFIAAAFIVFLMVRYIESFLDVFSIASGAGAFILSLGIPLALLLSLFRIASEDIEKSSQEDGIDFFETEIQSIDPPEILNGEKIVYFFDPGSKLCQEIEPLFLSEGDVLSVNTREYIDLDYQINSYPTIIGFIDGEEVGRIERVYSNCKMKKLLKALRKKMEMEQITRRAYSD